MVATLCLPSSLSGNERAARLTFQVQRPERSRPQGGTWRGVCRRGWAVVSTRRDRSLGPLERAVELNPPAADGVVRGGRGMTVAC